MTKIAIFSDSHDNIWMLEIALKQVQARAQMFCCIAAISVRLS